MRLTFSFLVTSGPESLFCKSPVVMKNHWLCCKYTSPSDSHISDLDDVLWFIDHKFSKILLPTLPYNCEFLQINLIKYTVFSDVHFQPGNSKRRPARNRMEINKVLNYS